MKSLDGGICFHLKYRKNHSILELMGTREAQSHSIHSGAGDTQCCPQVPRAGGRSTVSQHQNCKASSFFTGFRPPALPGSPQFTLQERMRSVGMALRGVTAVSNNGEQKPPPEKGAGSPLQPREAGSGGNPQGRTKEEAAEWWPAPAPLLPPDPPALFLPVCPDKSKNWGLSQLPISLSNEIMTTGACCYFWFSRWVQWKRWKPWQQQFRCFITITCNTSGALKDLKLLCTEVLGAPHSCCSPS